MKPLQKPRIPSFEGTETIPWSTVDKTFEKFLESYYKRHRIKKPNVKIESFNDCDETIKQWISAHSILGNPKSDTFDTAVVLPVVNPETGKLNKNALASAKAYLSRVNGISKNTIKDTKELITKLQEDNFDKSTGTENLIDLLLVLKR